MAIDPNDYLAGMFGGGSGGAGGSSQAGPLGGSATYGPGGKGTIREAERGRGPTTRVVEGARTTGPLAGEPFIGAYPTSGLGAGGDGYTEEDIAKILKGMPPEKVAEIQRKMQGIGLLPAEYKSWGFVENSMRSGFGELLQASNDRGETYLSTLDSLFNSGNGEDAFSMERMEQARKRAAQRDSMIRGFDTEVNVYKPSDPASFRQAAKAAFQASLGRNPTKDEEARFVSTFLGKERSNQSAGFALNDQLVAEGREKALSNFDADTAAEESLAAASVGGESGSESEILWQRVQKMIADSPYKITPGKKTRSYAEQVAAKEREKRGGPKAATPGKSKHGDGRANDLQYSSPKAREWALANAAKYGLHFPIYNPKLARANDESWHVEVLGGKGAGHSQGDGHAAMTAAAGPVSRDVTLPQQDLSAQAAEFARNENPVETAAYDIGGQFDNMLQILNRSVVA